MALRRLVQRLLRRPVFRKPQHTALVRLNGSRFKRVVFPDTPTAITVERQLVELEPLDLFPRLVRRHDHELLVTWVDGVQPEPGPATARAVGAFFGALATHGAPVETTDGEEVVAGLRRDLDFLREVGFIDGARHEDLHRCAEATRPARLYLGTDYLDAVLKNFVVRPDGSIVAIDVESIRSHAPLGLGLAKAQVHWLSDDLLPHAVEGLRQYPVPNFMAYFTFLRLTHAVRWTVTKILTGKGRRLHGRIPFDAPPQTLAQGETARPHHPEISAPEPSAGS